MLLTIEHALPYRVSFVGMIAGIETALILGGNCMCVREKRHEEM